VGPACNNFFGRITVFLDAIKLLPPASGGSPALGVRPASPHIAFSSAVEKPYQTTLTSILSLQGRGSKIFLLQLVLASKKFSRHNQTLAQSQPLLRGVQHHVGAFAFFYCSKLEQKPGSTKSSQLKKIQPPSTST